ncbi:hypothetical protein ACIGHN_11515 [Acidovorax sp. NPDC077693]|uniref:hypothetical protein n=1 Tax=unclassified Acidovorax TaxID=2684926 RepID=UPI0037C54D12
MQFKSEVIVHGVKESEGVVEGRAFSSTTFHCEVDLAENSAGRSIGRATRPFKLGDAKEFDKWAHLGASLPIKALATFEMAAAAADGTKMVLVDIRPVDKAPAKAV